MWSGERGMEGGPLGWLHRPCSHEKGRFFGFWGPDGDLVVISGLLKRCSSSHAVVIRTGGEGEGVGVVGWRMMGDITSRLGLV